MPKLNPKDYNPIRPADFGLVSHRVRHFDATVSGTFGANNGEALEFSNTWAFVAKQIQAGDEIRVLADDCSFRAELLCTYALGTEVKMKLIHFLPVDEVDYEKLNVNTGDYQVVQRTGIKKWCIIKTSTGEEIKDRIPTQSQAFRELEDYIRSMAA